MKTARYSLLICSTVMGLFWQGFAQTNEKLHIAILDFTTTGGVSKQETVTLGNRLRSMLVRTHAYVVLERGKMEEILQEQGFQQSGCTTTECAVEVGRLLNMQKMVSGSFGKVGQTYTIDLALIDVGTAQIEQSFFRDYKGQIDGLLEIMQVIANQIASMSITRTEPEVEKVLFTLSIDSDPPGALIMLNGRQAGETPFQSHARQGVDLEIRIQKKNYQDWVRQLTIEDDVHLDADLEFTNEYKRELAAKQSTEETGGSNTLYWIVGGAVLVGGAAVLILSASGGDGAQTEEDSFPKPLGRPD